MSRQFRLETRHLYLRVLQRGDTSGWCEYYNGGGWKKKEKAQRRKCSLLQIREKFFEDNIQRLKRAYGKHRDSCFAMTKRGRGGEGGEKVNVLNSSSIARTHSTVSRLSRPRSLLKCESSVSWKMFVSGEKRGKKVSLGM